MPVQPEDLFLEAQALFNRKSEEVERRTAASRCYYSFFHFANAYANDNAQVPPSAQAGPTHANLAEFFSNSIEHPMERRRKIKQVGIRLRACHRTRCLADYKIDAPFSEEELKVHHDACEKGVNGVKAL